jgi:hypothetical protein
MQWERHDAKPSVSEVLEVLRTGAGRRTLFNSNEGYVGEQELIDYDHGQTSIDHRLDGRAIVRHSVNNEAVNRGSSQDAFISFAALQEQ